jgi:hypothetical protein
MYLLYPHIPAASSSLLPWPGHPFRDCLLVVHLCTYTHAHRRRMLLPGLTRSSVSCRSSDLDTAFIVTNYEEDKKSDMNKVGRCRLTPGCPCIDPVLTVFSCCA